MNLTIFLLLTIKFSWVDTAYDIKWIIQDLVQVSKNFRFRNTFDFDPDSYDLFHYYGKFDDESWGFENYTGATLWLWIGIKRIEENDMNEDSKHEV